MGQHLGSLWSRIQGEHACPVLSSCGNSNNVEILHDPSLGWTDRCPRKQQVQRICDKVFDKYSDNTDHLALDNLHLVTLLVYDYINKYFPKPHKSPPSPEEIDDVVKDFGGRPNGNKKISRVEFCELIMKWLQRDLRTYMRYKALHVLAAAGSMATITKGAARAVPRLHQVVDKVPISLLASAYAVGFAVLDDVQVDIKL